MVALCLSVNPLNWTLDWLAQDVPRTLIFCFYVLLQTVSQMIKTDPMT